MYTPDGYMSAQLSAPERTPFASGDWVGQTQPRVLTLDGDTLSSRYRVTIMSSDEEVNSRLVWRRAEAR